MNKYISNEIMKRLKLRKKFLKTRNDTDKFNYNKQRNISLSFKRIEKKIKQNTM